MKQTKAQQIAIDATMALIDYYKKHFEDARRNAAERFSDSKSIIDSMRNSEGAIECEYRWNVVSPVIDRWEETPEEGRTAVLLRNLLQDALDAQQRAQNVYCPEGCSLFDGIEQTVAHQRTILLSDSSALRSMIRYLLNAINAGSEEGVRVKIYQNAYHGYDAAQKLVRMYDKLGMGDAQTAAGKLASCFRMVMSDTVNEGAFRNLRYEDILDLELVPQAKQVQQFDTVTNAKKLLDTLTECADAVVCTAEEYFAD
jgi:hypothetical protein